MNDAVSTTLQWQLDAPPWAWALAAVLSLSWIGWSYRREARSFPPARCALLGLLRILAAAVLLTMLAQPAIERRRLGRPRLVVLVDRSASMATEDEREAHSADQRPNSTTRDEAAAGAAQISRAVAVAEWLQAGTPSRWQTLAETYDLQVSAFAEAVDGLGDDESVVDAATPLADPGQGTRLGDALAQSLADGGGPPTAIVLLSDGIVTAGRSLASAAERARALGVPLYCVAVGSDRPRPDVVVDGVLVEPIVFPGDRVQVEARVRSAGYAGQLADVSLMVGDEAAATTTVELPADGAAAPVRLQWRPTKPGRVDATVVVQPFWDESDTDNNAASLSVEVREQPIRVLLAQSAPSFEFRALKDLLQRDPAIQLSVFLQEADAQFAEVDASAIDGFPLSADDFAEFDVVILGDFDPEMAPRGAWDALLAFVADEGGGLALVAGPQYLPAAYRDNRPMKTLLPLADGDRNPLRRGTTANQPLQIKPTAIGAELAMLQLGADRQQTTDIWRALPPVYWVYAPIDLKPGVEVLAVAEPLDVNAEEAATPGGGDSQQAVIVRQYIGAGEVLAHLTDETWRWRWRNDDRYFARYWGQAVRRLARGRVGRELARVSTDRVEYQEGDAVRILAQLRGAARGEAGALMALVRGQTTPVRRVPLAQRATAGDAYEAVLNDLPPDRYTVQLGDDSAASSVPFTVAAPPSEMTRLAVDWTALQQAAVATGGRAVRLRQADDLLDSLPPPSPTVLERLPAEPLWNHPWGIGLLTLLLAMEWFVRRRHGML